MAVVSTLITIGISLAISAAVTVAKMLLFPPARAQEQRRDVQTPADGKFNEKQNVPSLTDGFGRVKKGGDVVFLEESGGIVYWIFVVLGTRIEGFVEHYLHDELVTVGIDGYLTAPTHFQGIAVQITTRLGLDAETAWAEAIATFPTIWTEDHRGDGLAQLHMRCYTTNEDVFNYTFPQGMPLPTQVIDCAWLYDPRDEYHDPDDPSTWSYSRNIALGRLYHLTRPSGGKLKLADMYLPDWEAAADVCDETVTNKADEEEPRYQGGLWWHHDSDPVEIGRTIDQAGDLVVYIRADGLIGVHAGAYVTPDIRITEDNILEFTYAANRSVANTVLAVRGRFTDPANVYNTVDAAIWGDPYTGDETQRTKTIDNPAVQSHNHMQRLQKLAFIRANAARISLTIPYLAENTSRLVAQRRFVTVHYPARGLDEASVEIIGRPRLSLANLTISFEAIVVPETLYDFDAVYEEGDPPPVVDAITGEGIPTPTGFAVTFGTEVLAGGATSAFAIAAWTHVSDTFTYELEYQLSDESEAPRSVFSIPGQDSVRTPPLQDGAEYQFRLRIKSNGASGAWTSYITDTPVSDTTAPDPPTDLNITPGVSNALLSWTNPGSANFYKTVLYRGTVDTFALSSPIYTSYGGPSAERSYDDTGFISGTYYWWVEAYNASNVGSGEVGSVTATF